jgi:flavodoxin
MNRKKKIAVAVIAVVASLIVLFLSVALLDLMSFTATGSETLEPEGMPVGKALVVYSPGLSGQAERAAKEMAQALQSHGYLVKLAGVRSGAATNVTGYDVLIAGGPMYGGKVSSSIAEYLGDMEWHDGLHLGVFSTTGGTEYDDKAFDSLSDQVISLTMDTPPHPDPVVRLILTVNVEEDCAQMVDELLA